MQYAVIFLGILPFVLKQIKTRDMVIPYPANFIILLSP